MSKIKIFLAYILLLNSLLLHAQVFEHSINYKGRGLWKLTLKININQINNNINKIKIIDDTDNRILVELLLDSIHENTYLYKLDIFNQKVISIKLLDNNDQIINTLTRNIQLQAPILELSNNPYDLIVTQNDGYKSVHIGSEQVSNIENIELVKYIFTSIMIQAGIADSKEVLDIEDINNPYEISNIPNDINQLTAEIYLKNGSRYIIDQSLNY